MVTKKYENEVKNSPFFKQFDFQKKKTITFWEENYLKCTIAHKRHNFACDIYIS